MRHHQVVIDQQQLTTTGSGTSFYEHFAKKPADGAAPNQTDPLTRKSGTPRYVPLSQVLVIEAKHLHRVDRTVENGYALIARTAIIRTITLKVMHEKAVAVSRFLRLDDDEKAGGFVAVSCDDLVPDFTPAGIIQLMLPVQNLTNRFWRPVFL